MKIKIEKATIKHSVAHYLDNDLGLSPVIESDDDLREWTTYTISEISGHTLEGLADTGFAIAIDNDAMQLTVDAEILGVVRMHIL